MASTRKMAGYRLDPELHQAFRQKCIREGRTMNAVVNKLVSGWTKGVIRLDGNKKA
jgi:hypothetical protein